MMTMRWKLEGREWLGAVVCVSVLLGVGFYEFVHLPLQDKLQAAISQNSKLQAEVVSIENYQNAHLDFSVFEKDLHEQQARADHALPMQLDQGAFLNVVQQQALRHQVQLQGVIPGKAEEKDGVKALPIQLNFRCSYFALLSFLRELQESERYVLVKQTAVQMKDGQLDCEIVLNIFAMET